MPDRPLKTGPEERRGEGDIRPVPDPTTLTTAQSMRDMATLKEFIQIRFDQAQEYTRSRMEVIETRLASMDKAIHLVQQATDKIPQHVDEKIDGLRDVSEEKFVSIQTQFRERDVAVKAALDAAEKAVGKQNESFVAATAKSDQLTGKQMEQMSVQMQNDGRGKDDKINDLKDRVTRIEGRDTGSGMAWAVIATICGIVVGIIGVVVAVIGATKH
jgi:hypothetical protein